MNILPENEKIELMKYPGIRKSFNNKIVNLYLNISKNKFKENLNEINLIHSDKLSELLKYLKIKEYLLKLERTNKEKYKEIKKILASNIKIDNIFNEY